MMIIIIITDDDNNNNDDDDDDGGDDGVSNFLSVRHSLIIKIMKRFRRQ